MQTQHQKNRSKQLSWLLRHGAREKSLCMDAAGWCAVADVLRITRLRRDELEQLVATNTKSRLELVGERVRACQGHSVAMPVTREALEASWSLWTEETMLWHGTTIAALPDIRAQGLCAQGRTHVHLASATDSPTGKRAQVAVLLGVDPCRLGAQGLPIFASANGVILVRHAPPACIVAVRCCTAAARAQEAQIRSIFAE